MSSACGRACACSAAATRCTRKSTRSAVAAASTTPWCRSCSQRLVTLRKRRTEDIKNSSFFADPGPLVSALFQLSHDEEIAVDELHRDPVTSARAVAATPEVVASY